MTIRDSLLAVCLSLMVASGAAAQSATRADDGGSSGLWLGGQGGAIGGSSLWDGYDVVDGSGSYFLGTTLGYGHRVHGQVVVGADADINFTAQPTRRTGVVTDVPDAFGALVGRVGSVTGHTQLYGAAGVAWAHDQVRVVVSGTTAAFTSTRTGWTVGGGLQRAINGQWGVDARYMFTHLGRADGQLPVGGRLAVHQLSVGMTYAFDGAASQPSPGASGLETGGWSLHGQTTLVGQYAAPFRAPYRGANSLDPNIARETWDLTFYVGRQLWNGGAVWIDPEIDQGYGLSNTLGAAGFPSGEAYKAGYTVPYARVPRAFLQQTINLGGERESVDSGLNQFGGSRTSNRLVITAGKFGVGDVFDAVPYAHDPRTDFMNWSLIDTGTFDYAADAWGFTYGAAVEWDVRQWAARAGVFNMSSVPNSTDLGLDFGQHQFAYELEHRQTLHGLAGKVAAAGFVSHARMGTFADALALAARTGGVPDTANVRRVDNRPGVHVVASQDVAPGIGLFARAGWAHGDFETFEFTDIDRTASVGASINGARWHRAADTFAVATVINAISDVHARYLAAGGLGILVGDGALPHPGRESIVESYYRLGAGPWQLTADYQFIAHPAFNPDRGPVSAIAIRVRRQF